MHLCQLYSSTKSFFCGVSILEIAGSILTCCKRPLSFAVSSSSVKKDPSPCSSAFPDDLHCIGCNGNVCDAKHTQYV